MDRESAHTPSDLRRQVARLPSRVAAPRAVQDDGRGFDLAHVEQSYAERASFGLLSMHERAEIANERLDILSKPGRGTTVPLTKPLE